MDEKTGCAFAQEGYAVHGKDESKDTIIYEGEGERFLSSKKWKDFLVGKWEGVRDTRVFENPPTINYGEVVLRLGLFEKKKQGGIIDESGGQRVLVTIPFSRFNIPKHVRFVEEFSMTVAGKPQKFVLREEMVQELLREEEEEGHQIG